MKKTAADLQAIAMSLGTTKQKISDSINHNGINKSLDSKVEEATANDRVINAAPLLASNNTRADSSAGLRAGFLNANSLKKHSTTFRHFLHHIHHTIFSALLSHVLDIVSVMIAFRSMIIL